MVAPPPQTVSSVVGVTSRAQPLTACQRVDEICGPKSTMPVLQCCQRAASALKLAESAVLCRRRGRPVDSRCNRRGDRRRETASMSRAVITTPGNREAHDARHHRRADPATGASRGHDDHDVPQFAGSPELTPNQRLARRCAVRERLYPSENRQQGWARLRARTYMCPSTRPGRVSFPLREFGWAPGELFLNCGTPGCNRQR